MIFLCRPSQPSWVDSQVDHLRGGEDQLHDAVDQERMTRLQGSCNFLSTREIFGEGESQTPRWPLQVSLTNPRLGLLIHGNSIHFYILQQQRTRNLIHIHGRIPVSWTILSSVQQFHILRRQLKVKHLRILLDPLRRRGLGQRQKSLIQSAHFRGSSIRTILTICKLHRIKT